MHFMHGAAMEDWEWLSNFEELRGRGYGYCHESKPAVRMTGLLVPWPIIWLLGRRQCGSSTLPALSLIRDDMMLFEAKQKWKCFFVGKGVAMSRRIKPTKRITPCSEMVAPEI